MVEVSDAGARVWAAFGAVRWHGAVACCCDVKARGGNSRKWGPDCRVFAVERARGSADSKRRMLKGKRAA